MDTKTTAVRIIITTVIDDDNNNNEENNNKDINQTNNERNPEITNNSLSDPWAGVAGGMAPPQQTSNDWGAGADVSIFLIVGCNTMARCN